MQAAKAPTPARGARRPGLAVAGLVFDLVAPVALYYALRADGVSFVPALLAGAALPALGAAWTLLRRRRADPVAVLMVASLGSSVIVSVIADSPRVLLAKDGLITGVWGVWFLASVRGRRPAALTFAQPLMEGVRLFGGHSWDGLWATEPQFRRIWRMATVMWGTGLLVDAVIRVVISYARPIDQVPGLGGALYPITFVALQMITNVYYTRAGLYRLLGARWLERPRTDGDHGAGGASRTPCPPNPQARKGTGRSAARPSDQRSVECSLMSSPLRQNPRTSTT